MSVRRGGAVPVPLSQIYFSRSNWWLTFEIVRKIVFSRSFFFLFFYAYREFTPMNSYPSPLMTLTHSYAPPFYHDHTGFKTRETQINSRRLYNYKLYTKPEEILLQVLLVLDGTNLPIRRRKALR